MLQQLTDETAVSKFVCNYKPKPGTDCEHHQLPRDPGLVVVVVVVVHRLQLLLLLVLLPRDR